MSWAGDIQDFGLPAGPLDLEKTPDANAPRKFPEWAETKKDSARPCYICGGLSTSYAAWHRYWMFVHPWCYDTFGTK